MVRYQVRFLLGACCHGQIRFRGLFKLHYATSQIYLVSNAPAIIVVLLYMLLDCDMTLINKKWTWTAGSPLPDNSTLFKPLLEFRTKKSGTQIMAWMTDQKYFIQLLTLVRFSGHGLMEHCFIDHLNTRLVRYSDPLYIAFCYWTLNITNCYLGVSAQ